jgi:site-specific recombinase XerD
MKGSSLQTIQRYRTQVSFFIRWSGVKQIEAINKDTILSFLLNGRVERNWSPSTFRTYHMSLHVFFSWCVQNGHCENNYTKNIELPKIQRSLPKGLSKENAEKLLEIIFNLPYTNEYQRYRNHAIFATFMFTGLRRGELLNLNLSDVDVENQTLFVRCGKGNKDRIIPMSSTLLVILNRYLVERKKQRKTCPEFFTSSVRNAGFTKHGLKYFVERLKKVSGIKFNLHELRHTFATFMLEGGCDIYSLSRMLGHSDIKTTTIYLSASAKHLRNQISKHPLNSKSALSY